MEKFLNKAVIICTCLGGVYGSGSVYKGIVTSYDDDFICLDNNTYIDRRFIMTIKIK